MNLFLLLFAYFTVVLTEIEYLFCGISNKKDIKIIIVKAVYIYYAYVVSLNKSYLCL